MDCPEACYLEKRTMIVSRDSEIGSFLSQRLCFNLESKPREDKRIPNFGKIVAKLLFIGSCGDTFKLPTRPWHLLNPLKTTTPKQTSLFPKQAAYILKGFFH